MTRAKNFVCAGAMIIAAVAFTSLGVWLCILGDLPAIIRGDDQSQLAIINARYGTDEHRIDVPDLLRPLIAHDCLLLRARWDLGHPDPAPNKIKDVQIVYRQVERVRTVLATLHPGSLTGMDLKGRLPCRLSLSAKGRERVLALELLPRELLFSWPKAGLGCSFGGSFRAEGPLQGWLHRTVSLAGRIQGTGHFELPPLEVRRFRFDVPWAGMSPLPR